MFPNTLSFWWCDRKKLTNSWRAARRSCLSLPKQWITFSKFLLKCCALHRQLQQYVCAWKIDIWSSDQSTNMPHYPQQCIWRYGWLSLRASKQKKKHQTLFGHSINLPSTGRRGRATGPRIQKWISEKSPSLVTRTNLCKWNRGRRPAAVSEWSSMFRAGSPFVLMTKYFTAEPKSPWMRIL